MQASESLTASELSRYSRHLTLPEVGVLGQQKLKDASVLIVGAGGLGSPASLYLTAAGVGRIGLVEFDSVDLTNLQRQLLYETADVGRRKLDAARERLEATNPEVTIECFDTRLTSQNALDIIRRFDIVVDGSDNFPTRYLVNDAAVIAGVPVVYGSIHRFEGQVSVFGEGDGPCYRCLFREPPPAGAVPNCAEAGVLGVLPGIVGTLQATEAIKLILGIGESLSGRLLLVNALDMSFRTIELRRDPDCPACGKTRTGVLEDYDRVCAVSEVRSITPGELASRLERGDDIDLVDVREPYEWNISRIPGARLVPLSSLTSNLDSFNSSRDTVVYCKVGMRSEQAAEWLASAGLEKVSNLSGGILRWRADVDPTLPEY